MPIRRNTFTALAAAIGGISTFNPTLAVSAEMVLEEVIVTAQIREERLQDVPISVNAVSGDKLLSAGIDKIEDLQAYVPNLTMSETGIGTNIYIRGIGSGINQGFEQSTGMYVDGISYSRAQLSRAPFLDLARVEVLRGPQNILFGKNSIAGAISMTTNKPGDQFEGLVSLLYEPEHDEQIADVVVSGPLTPNLGARLAYRNRTMDGYIENITIGGDEPERDEETIRLTLDFNPTEDLGITFKYESGEFDVNGRQMEITDESPNAAGQTYSDILATGVVIPLGSVFPAQDPSVRNTTQDYKRSSNGDTSENNTENFTLTVDYALGDHTLTFIGGYLEYDYTEDCDCDFTGANIFTLLSEEEYDQTSLELRLVSPTGSTFEYIGGLYYQESDLQFNDRFFVRSNSLLIPFFEAAVGPGAGTAISNTSSPRDFQQDSDMIAVFAQTTWNISDDFRLNLGLRYSKEEKDASRTLDIQGVDGSTLSPLKYAQARAVNLQAFLYEPHSIDGERTDEDLAPQISVEWDINEDVMLYASATEGSKSGGFDVRSNADPRTGGALPVGAFEFEDESATSFETGAKSVFLNGAAEINVALFYTEYDDLQISIYDGKVGFNVGNAAEAETYGLELDGRMMLTPSLMLSGAIALIDFEFTDFEDGQCYSGETPTNATKGTCSRDGDTNQYVADWSGNLSLDHFFELGGGLQLRSGLDAIFTDDYNPSQSLDPALDQDGYVKLNARIALGDIDNIWEVALIGKNLTDEEIMTYGAPAPLAYGTFGTPSYYTFWERERSVALQGTFRF